MLKEASGSRVLIDAHGPDHGLRVAISGRGDGRTVEIREWAESPEPNQDGECETWCHVAHVPLSDVLAPHAKHRGSYSGDGPSGSVQEAVISAAISYLAYWGGEVEYASDGPCAHFGMYWGRHQRSHRLGCEECGEFSGGPCDCHPKREGEERKQAVDMGGVEWLNSPQGKAWREDSRKASKGGKNDYS